MININQPANEAAATMMTNQPANEAEATTMNQITNTTRAELRRGNIALKVEKLQTRLNDTPIEKSNKIAKIEQNLSMLLARQEEEEPT